MSSIVHKWEELCGKSKFLEFIDIMVMGFSQITLNCNPICGVVLLISVAIASPVQLLSGIWSVFVATVLIYALGIPLGQAREGLYTINPALAGLAVPMVTYVNDIHALPQILMFSTVGAILSVLLTAGMRRILSTWQVSPLAAPYSIALMLISSSTYYLTAMNPKPMFTPGVVALQESAGVIWSVKDFCVAVLNGIAQVMWIEDVPRSAIAGIVVLIGIAIASRIDALITVYAVILATGTAVLLGIGQGGIMLGLYGYNAILLSLVLFGRAFKMSKQSFLMITVLSVVSVVFAAGLKPFFAVIGAPVAAFPFAIISISAMLGRKYFANLDYMAPPTWKTPEESRNIQKSEEAEL